MIRDLLLSAAPSSTTYMDDFSSGTYGILPWSLEYGQAARSDSGGNTGACLTVTITTTSPNNSRINLPVANIAGRVLKFDWKLVCSTGATGDLGNIYVFDTASHIVYNASVIKQFDWETKSFTLDNDSSQIGFRMFQAFSGNFTLYIDNFSIT